MKRVGIIIGGQLVGMAIQLETPAGDTVAVTADHRAKIRAILDIGIQVVVAQDNITQLTIFVGDLQGNHNAAVSHDARLSATIISQQVEIHGLPVRRQTKGHLRDRALGRLGRDATGQKRRAAA